jgi:sulfite exporter TauE/SafE
LFAAIAGLAATFTACNCVVFAMMPGLICSAEQSNQAVSPLKALGAFMGGVLVVCAAYGAFVGTLGADGVEAYNQRDMRLTQAQVVFTALGVVMLGWGLIELGFVGFVQQWVSPSVQAFLGTATTKAGLIGLLVGLVAVGRPFPVFREFLTYAASAESPLYGAGAMMVQGLDQIAVMALLFVAMVFLGGRRLARWAAQQPHQPYLLSGLALIGGGAFFVFYWGLAFVLDIGRWGFKLGWY